MPMERNRYEEKQEAHRERLEDRAERLAQEGRAKVAEGDKMFGVIPFGQPMMPGHHSYNRDRNFRERARNKITNGYAQMREADEVARRAAAVGTGGVSSDDPDAVVKLREQLEKLEARQELMAAVNKLVRKHTKDPEAGAKAIAEAFPEISEGVAAKLFVGDFAGRKGFPSYELTNNGANIRRIKGRIEELKRAESRETTETTVNGVRIVESAEANRLQMFFPGKPSEAIRTEMKRSGFRWSPSEGAWQRHLGVNAKWTAEQIAGKLEEDVS